MSLNMIASTHPGGRGRGSTPAKCWQESREEYARRLKRCCEEVNKECDVEGLCKSLPKRMKLLQDTDGDRLKN